MNHGALKKGQRPKSVTKMELQELVRTDFCEDMVEKMTTHLLILSLYQEKEENKICRIKVYRFVES